MSHVDLPPELLAHIVSYLAPEGPLSPYASISRDWQYAVEAHTFSSLRFETDGLTNFECLVADSCVNRRAAVKSINFTAVLPTYDDIACAQFEKEADKQANNESFSESIQRLFSALAKCDDVANPRPIKLLLHAPYSPMDRGHRDHMQPIRSDKGSENGLLGQSTDWPRLWKYEMQRNALGDLYEHSHAVRSVIMELMDPGPLNETFTLPDVRGESEDGDALSMQLSRYLKSEHLVNVQLDGPIVVGPELFSLSGGEGATVWPSLERFLLSFSTHRPDGGWYFERDPTTSPESIDPDEEAWEGSESEEESDSAFDSDESFFEVDPAKPDHYNEAKEERLQGFKPINCFRTQPNAHLEAFLGTMAVAVGRMPKLRYFAAGADVAHCKRTEYAGPSFECEFTAVHDREKARLHWTVPQGWSMGEPLKELWEKIIGVDGTVDYEECEDDLAGATATANGARKGTKSKTGMTKSTAAKGAPKRKAAPKQNARQPLKDRTNVQSDNEEMEGAEVEDAQKPKAKRAKTTTASRKPKKAAEQLGVIPETQQDPADDVEESIEIDGRDVPETAQPPSPQHNQRFAQRPRSTSVQPTGPTLQPRASARSASAQPASGYRQQRERSGSVSGTERERRGGDPELRRKLNDVTKKYEDLSLKYQNLQEIGKDSAESNFERLKRTSDQRAKDADALIAGLKKEIAELRKNSKEHREPKESPETANLRKEVSSLTTEKERMSKEHSETKEKLQTAQNEAKSLEAKLVAARQQLSASTTSSNGSQQDGKGVPASAQKNSQLNRGGTSIYSSEAQKEAKMKENLYSDLTGMIIRGVKRKDGEDEYDCIQTGRNGTLHFHLSVANETTATTPKTPSGSSYEDAEFAYEPFLDPHRDAALLDLLPDYLTEEICFPRSHAVKFYSKVGECMTKKVVMDEEESG
ncbi:hypothetical protein KC340_g13915 [Hortaea werneckii]|nr:hypothetical protein KC342_g14212 [Hortaea werneckii]KAI7067775.1 hypothetical protein KC339_g15230 [Hortaea werneckii]KAI7222050.1 hypothetical protein KC365_g11523 [Hortaea werneckii]KAI7299185.1 hypothetical protein KC340_g13915 [Hortaea werneckii]KAI7378752.1 hypothetical protein KC328_g13723 [Hortaea werneckii]